MFGEALPILFVSSERTEPSDRVAGLLLGADDYLAKPIDSDELLARIRRSATRSMAHSREAHANGSGAQAGEQLREALGVDRVLLHDDLGRDDLPAQVEAGQECV